MNSALHRIAVIVLVRVSNVVDIYQERFGRNQSKWFFPSFVFCWQEWLCVFCSVFNFSSIHGYLAEEKEKQHSAMLMKRKRPIGLPCRRKCKVQRFALSFVATMDQEVLIVPHTMSCDQNKFPLTIRRISMHHTLNEDTIVEKQLFLQSDLTSKDSGWSIPLERTPHQLFGDLVHLEGTIRFTGCDCLSTLVSRALSNMPLVLINNILSMLQPCPWSVCLDSPLIKM
jgi:hypothetical protein